MEEATRNCAAGFARGNVNVLTFWQDHRLGKGSFAILAHLTEFCYTDLKSSMVVRKVYRSNNAWQAKNSYIPPIRICLADLDNMLIEFGSLFGDKLWVKLGDIDGNVGLKRHRNNGGG
jgi:hypothetical protein